MRPSFLNLLCGGFALPLLLACSTVYRTPSPDVAAAVLRSEDARFRAQVAADTAAVGRLLAPELTYTHSNALVENRREFVADIASKKLVYHELTPQTRAVRVSRGTALVTGRVRVSVTLEGKGPIELVLQYTEVYVRRGGNWLLLAWHSARVPA